MLKVAKPKGHVFTALGNYLGGIYYKPTKGKLKGTTQKKLETSISPESWKFTVRTNVGDYFRLRGDRIFRKGGEYSNRFSFKRLAAIPTLGASTYFWDQISDTVGDGMKWLFQPKESIEDTQQKPTPKDDKKQVQWFQPLVNGWNTSINWIKKNPGWAAGIGASVVGIPLVAWLLTKNNDQDQQYAQEDKDSYKYKYGQSNQLA